MTWRSVAASTVRPCSTPAQATYVASPAGFQVDVGHGARLVAEDWDQNRRYDRISTWGHQPLRTR